MIGITRKYPVLLACSFAVFVVVPSGCSLIPSIDEERKLVIVENSKPTSWVMLPLNAAPPEQLAARELVNYLEKMSGARLEVNPLTPKTFGNEIIIASLEDGPERISRDVAEQLQAAQEKEAFYIKTEGDKLYLCGKTPLGALYATYTFLETLGVAWFYPSRDGTGEECPRKETVEIDDVDLFKTSVLPQSTLNLTSASKGFNESLEWLTRNKLPYFLGTDHPHRIFTKGTKAQGEKFLRERDALSPRKIGGHVWFDQAVPAKIHFDSHPEYFPLVNGKRIHQTMNAKGNNNVQRCFSNPVVGKLCGEDVSKGVAEGRMIMFCPADNVNVFCHCPNCRKMGSVDGTFSPTNLYHRFFADTIDYALERNPHPTNRIEVWPYIEYRACPIAEDVKYDPRFVTITLTMQRCYAHDFDDQKCKRNQKAYENYKKWTELCPNIKFYEYIQCAGCKYAPFEYKMSETFKLLGKNGNKGWIDECNPRFGCYVARWRPERDDFWLARWQLNYILAKYSWDSDLDIDELMEDIYKKYYGTAYPPMAKYHEFRRKLWNSAPGHSYYGGPKRTAWCLTVPGATDKLDAYLREAEQLADGDEKILKRLGVDRYFLDTYWKPQAAELLKQLNSEKRIVPRRADSKITIDGDLDETVWLKARPVEKLMTMRTKTAAPEKTNMRVAYDPDHFYFAVEAYENKAWSPAKAHVKDRDGDVWTDDSIEIQIVPPGEENLTNYFHLICNTNGTVYDAIQHDKSFNSNADVKVKKFDDRYVYEIALPVKEMGWKIQEGDVWKAFLLRNCHNLQPPQTQNISSIDGALPHRPIQYRKMVIGGNVVKNGNFAELAAKNAPKTKIYGKADAIKGDEGLAYWGARGKKVELIKQQSGHFVKLIDAVLYGRLAVKRNPGKQMIKGVLRASGTGKITLKARVDTDYKDCETKMIDVFTLSGKPTDYGFEFPLEPRQGVILYIHASDATLEFISAVQSPFSEATPTARK